MEVSKDDFSELEMGTSVESFQKFLVVQKELFHNQIDELQKIVVTQCRLTGVNPLSQEMAAGALSIKIGKRPRDLLNPKAVNYMQSVFSIKDAITKKESREISALFGVTVTQVRDFFNCQRSRVRRLVRLSRERAIRSNTCEEPQDEFPTSCDPMRPINPVPLNSVGSASAEEASCSTQENHLTDLDEVDKHFADNIFNLMRKEETFSGQEKLMEWILKIQNSSVLCWFLDQGGARILVMWLSEAAIEEQTSVLLLVLKVLSHLPLHKAQPIHMPAILQSVNRLRFYKTSDISNRARVLLSRWSKLLARNQAAKKLNGVKPSSDAQKESIGQIVGNESWDSTIDVPEDILALTNEGLNNFRKLEAPQSLKLLPASSDDMNKRPILGVSSSQNRERRKVQLVEQPGHKTVRSPQATRAASVNQGRPMSTDDIQKAKMRALFMKSKHGKAASSKESKEARTDGLHKPSISESSAVASLSKVPVSQKIDEDKKPMLLSSKISNGLESSLDSNLSLDLGELTWEKCKRVPIPWKIPAEVKLNDAWRIGTGENSKEIEVQKNRHRREKETIYQSVHEIPTNPKEPWDREMEYDDSLTLEIPVEQLPDSEGTEAPVANNHGATDAVQRAATSSSSGAEPDLELLAVLLKNPELVFALTSGQAGGLESQDTVKLLDMIKKGGVNLAANVNGVGEKAQEKVEVSLPSPTPSSDPGTTGWKTEAARNPFSRQSSVSDRISHSSPAVASANLVLSQIPVTGNVVTQRPASMAPPSQSQHHASTISPYSLLQAAAIVAERQPRQPSLAPSSVHPSFLTNSATIQTPSSDIGLTMKNIITANASSSVYVSRAHSPLTMRVDGTSNVKPVANLSVQEEMSNSFRQQSRMFPSPTAPGSTSHPQRHPHLLQQSNFSEPPYHNPGSSYRPQIEKPAPIFGQDMSSNYHPQYNQNNYNGMVGGLMQSGNSWERNNHGRDGFESWSPENSPTRHQGYYSQRRNVPPESRINPGKNYGPEWSRQPSSSGYWEPGRQGNRKWHDRRR